MRFIDEAKIKVKGGDGGPGIVAWRREKFVPLGGPAGGNGGRGGDVIFVAKEGMNSLLDLKQQAFLKGLDGKKGQPKNKAGRAGEDRHVFVPVGTVIEDESRGGVRLADLTSDQDYFRVCRGGNGGFGNAHFKDGLCSAPEKATAGESGEEKQLKLTLKLMADVGLLGFPSVGKSTLLRRLSNAKPKVAEYHFTTIKPMVGVCELDLDSTMIIADIPGLIEGASENIGLGFRFLRHLERVRILCHLVDASEPKTLKERFLIINRELKNYSEELFLLPQLVAINKMDALPAEDEAELEAFEAYLAKQGIKSIRISAANGQGLAQLKEVLFAKVNPNHGVASKPKTFDPTLSLY